LITKSRSKEYLKGFPKLHLNTSIVVEFLSRLSTLMTQRVSLISFELCDGHQWLVIIYISLSNFFFFDKQSINKIKGILQGYPNPYTVAQKWASYIVHKKDSPLWLGQSNLKVRQPTQKKQPTGYLKQHTTWDVHNRCPLHSPRHATSYPCTLPSTTTDYAHKEHATSSTGESLCITSTNTDRRSC